MIMEKMQRRKLSIKFYIIKKIRLFRLIRLRRSPEQLTENIHMKHILLKFQNIRANDENLF